MYVIKLLLLLSLTGCTVLTTPPTSTVDMDRVKITHCELGFLKTGWACSEIRNQPKWLHPIVIATMGCAVKYFDADGLASAVIFADYDWTYDHEMGHLNGWDDGTEVFYSHDEATRVMATTEKLVSENKDRCN